MSHEAGFNAMIGGPHSSFEFLCESAGNVGTMIAQFVSGLERYKAGDWSAPKLPYMSMTTEELAFAEEMNVTEVGILSEYGKLLRAEELKSEEATAVQELVEEILDESGDEDNLNDPAEKQLPALHMGVRFFRHLC